MFLDEAVVEVSSGRGGDGSASFHREKHVPRGGPNGADGGRGGSVFIVADSSVRTLYDFKLRPTVRAQDGASAQNNRRGKDAPDVELRVPVGTVVFDEDSGARVVDLDTPGARARLVKGGRGGFGNLHFVSSVRRAPAFAEKGEPGECRRVRLSLKLLADIGLIGLPNAGKSTLIASISAAKPKIADYPFTTVTPNLGVVSVDDETFVVADLPGLIEGAGEGRGLGHRFLKHAERTRALVHLAEAAPPDGSDPLENLRIVEAELKRYSSELHSKPRLVALSKVDLVPPEKSEELVKRMKTLGYPVFAVSAATGQGVRELLYAMLAEVRRAPTAQETVEVITLEREDERAWTARREEQGFRVDGKGIERLVQMTDFSSQEAIRRLHRKLERIGLIQKLRELGAREGDAVFIGDTELSFTDEQ